LVLPAPAAHHDHQQLLYQPMFWPTSRNTAIMAMLVLPAPAAHQAQQEQQQLH
jgi:hypothetical protein